MQDVQTIAVKSHSPISTIVTRCLQILTPNSDGTTKTNVMEVIADAKVAGKAITIAEIVKRRITERGETIHQTTRVHEKPITTEVGMGSEGTHLQGEGYLKPIKKLDAQIIIRLEKSRDVKE